MVMDVIKEIEKLKLVPVAVIEDKENAIPLGEALLEAGLPVVEVTFRTLSLHFLDYSTILLNQ